MLFSAPDSASEVSLIAGVVAAVLAVLIIATVFFVLVKR